MSKARGRVCTGNKVREGEGVREIWKIEIDIELETEWEGGRERGRK